MPENEAPKEEQQEQKAAGQFMSTRAWIVVVSLYVCTIVAGAVYVQLTRNVPDKDRTPTTEQGEIAREKLSLYHQYTVPMQNLSYSILTPTGQSQTLMMSIDIVLGRTPQERLESIELKAEDWDEYKNAVIKMAPLIKDKLNQHVRQQSQTQLNSLAGQDRIKQFVRELINEELKRLDLNLSSKKFSSDRVTAVYIQEYIIQ